MSKQLNFLMKAQTKRHGDDAMSVSDSEDDVPEWRKGMNENQAMYVAQAYRTDNDLAYDECINNIDPDEIKKYKKMYKKAKRSLWNEVVQADKKLNGGEYRNSIIHAKRQNNNTVI